MASSSSSTAPTQSPPNPEGPFFSDFGITDSGEFYAKNNPFQRSGPVGATERIAMAKNDKVTYVRVDMPGVPKECQYLTTFPDNVVFCGGLAPMVCKGGRGRLYGASYGLRSYKLRKPQVNISNGVATVKMKVSKKSKTGTRCSNSPSWDEELKKDELSFYLVTHPSETEGPKETYGAKKVKEGFYVWVDMPGATKEKVSVGVEDGFVVFSGEAVNESNHEESGRTYKGRFGPFDVTKIGEIKTDVRNGVLRMLIPEKADE
ncbi:uncharacterized protein LOC126708389 [Quercus robur]|uniref:uncharacterized protein LOC126708389 n=1 Tax=Quercus robur TaxID=38942 RepID=UPI0021635723|nr:uncharacterized protein LOC126708389 [Quercus robur]